MGNVEQDRARNSSVDRAVIEARQHNQACCWWNIVGHWQQNRHRRNSADAGNDAHEITDGHAEETIEQVLQRQSLGKPQRKIIQKPHVSPA